MVLKKETRTEILRLFYGEKFTAHAIAKHLMIHHNSVKNVIDKQFSIAPSRNIRSSIVDHFVPFILQKIEEYQKITGTRLFQMIKDRGYQGSYKAFKKKLCYLRLQYPLINKRAFLPLITYKGEEGQVDWAHFGSMQIGKATRKLSCFAMILSHSRSIYATFTFDQGISSFLSSHVKAFHYFGGVPKKLRYDNLKTAVIDRHQSSVRYNDDLLDFAGHYHFQPSACNPYSGHEKGKVERSIRYIRENFFIGREFKNIEDANLQIHEWLETIANKRFWPQDRSEVVLKIWDEEKKYLLPLPVHDAHTLKMHSVRAKKYPYINFDLNHYSIPCTLVGVGLNLSADFESVIIFDSGKEITRHKRSYDKGVRVTIESHLENLKETHPGSYTVAVRAKLIQIIPELNDFYSLMIDYKIPLGKATSSLEYLVKQYGENVVKNAVKEALDKKIIKTSYLSQLCQKYAPSLRTNSPLDLSSSPRINNISVPTHELSNYDNL